MCNVKVGDLLEIINNNQIEICSDTQGELKPIAKFDTKEFDIRYLSPDLLNKDVGSVYLPYIEEGQEEKDAYVIIIIKS